MRFPVNRRQSYRVDPFDVTGGYLIAKDAVRPMGIFSEKRLPLIVITGLPGSGKTELLEHLAGLGEQIIDLERLARHHGSAFGGIKQPPQPSHEEFQYILSDLWRHADPERPLWIEDEGPFIGSVGLPRALWNLLVCAPTVSLQTSRIERVTRILNEYGSLPVVDLLAALRKTAHRLGEKRTADAISTVAFGRRREAVEIILPYFDDAYRHRTARRRRKIIATFAPSVDDLNELVRHVRRYFEVR